MEIYEKENPRSTEGHVQAEAKMVKEVVEHDTMEVSVRGGTETFRSHFTELLSYKPVAVII